MMLLFRPRMVPWTLINNCNLNQNTKETKALPHSELTVWDEAPTKHVHIIQTQITAQFEMIRKEFFRETYTFSKDFRKSYQHSHDLCIQTLKLTCNMWTEREKDLSDWLLEDDECATAVKIASILFPNTQHPVEQLYGDINSNTVTVQQLKGRTVMLQMRIL